jgi:hypothetical protein
MAVGVDLQIPERRIPAGSLAVFWAAMPETAVDEDCQSCCSKDEVRLSW